MQHNYTSMEELIQDWSTCMICKIGCWANKHVFLDTIPEGCTKVDVLMIGEGPGMGEDALGKPFIGPAGKLLRKAIEYAIASGPYYCELRIGLANLLVCRPTNKIGGNNRVPLPVEVENCTPRLRAMIEVLQPTMLVPLGREAQYYLPQVAPELYTNQESPMMRAYHPSFILRQGGEGTALYDEYVRRLTVIFNTTLHLINKEKTSEP
jgi:uracil-DNA glycosylase